MATTNCSTPLQSTGSSSPLIADYSSEAVQIDKQHTSKRIAATVFSLYEEHAKESTKKHLGLETINPADQQALTGLNTSSTSLANHITHITPISTQSISEDAAAMPALSSTPLVPDSVKGAEADFTTALITHLSSKVFLEDVAVIQPYCQFFREMNQIYHTPIYTILNKIVESLYYDIIAHLFKQEFIDKIDHLLIRDIFEALINLGLAKEDPGFVDRLHKDFLLLSHQFGLNLTEQQHLKDHLAIIKQIHPLLKAHGHSFVFRENYSTEIATATLDPLQKWKNDLRIVNSQIAPISLLLQHMLSKDYLLVQQVQVKFPQRKLVSAEKSTQLKLKAVKRASKSLSFYLNMRVAEIQIRHRQIMSDETSFHYAESLRSELQTISQAISRRTHGMLSMIWQMQIAIAMENNSIETARVIFNQLLMAEYLQMYQDLLQTILEGFFQISKELPSIPFVFSVHHAFSCVTQLMILFQEIQQSYQEDNLQGLINLLHHYQIAIFPDPQPGSGGIHIIHILKLMVTAFQTADKRHAAFLATLKTSFSNLTPFITPNLIKFILNRCIALCQKVIDPLQMTDITQSSIAFRRIGQVLTDELRTPAIPIEMFQALIQSSLQLTKMNKDKNSLTQLLQLHKVYGKVPAEQETVTQNDVKSLILLLPQLLTFVTWHPLQPVLYNLSSTLNVNTGIAYNQCAIFIKYINQMPSAENLVTKQNAASQDNDWLYELDRDEATLAPELVPEKPEEQQKEDRSVDAPAEASTPLVPIPEVASGPIMPIVIPEKIPHTYDGIIAIFKKAITPFCGLISPEASAANAQKIRDEPFQLVLRQQLFALDALQRVLSLRDRCVTTAQKQLQTAAFFLWGHQVLEQGLTARQLKCQPTTRKPLSHCLNQLMAASGWEKDNIWSRENNCATIYFRYPFCLDLTRSAHRPLAWQHMVNPSADSNQTTTQKLDEDLPSWLTKLMDIAAATLLDHDKTPSTLLETIHLLSSKVMMMKEVETKEDGASSASAHKPDKRIDMQTQILRATAESLQKYLSMESLEWNATRNRKRQMLQNIKLHIHYLSELLPFVKQASEPNYLFVHVLLGQILTHSIAENLGRYLSLSDHDEMQSHSLQAFCICYQLDEGLTDNHVALLQAIDVKKANEYFYKRFPQPKDKAQYTRMKWISDLHAQAMAGEGFSVPGQKKRSDTELYQEVIKDLLALSDLAVTLVQNKLFNNK